MADMSINISGIKSPNPFWLASGPPTNSGDQIQRAFEAGWGGAVWKTLGVPIRNVHSRYAAINKGKNRIVGLNNIELISDRGLSVNLREMAEVKKNWPDHAVIASIMVGPKAEWKELIQRAEDAGADGLELNFGCPHGMCERGLGSAIGQEPKVTRTITEWAKEFASIPVIIKLSPNVTDICDPGMAAKEGGADGVALINTIKSIIGVDLDDFIPYPKLRNGSTNGGYCGQAVKPIALHMVASLARNRDFGLPISGMGGIANWADAAEFIALGCTSVQVCTEVMHHGFGLVNELLTGLEGYLDSKGMRSVNELIGKAVPNVKNWGDLDMNYKIVATVDQEKCVGCHACHVACRDSMYSAMELPEGARRGKTVPTINKDKCVGCNLCSLVCPADAITMKDISPSDKSESWNELMAQGGFVHEDGLLANK